MPLLHVSSKVPLGISMHISLAGKDCQISPRQYLGEKSDSPKYVRLYFLTLSCILLCCSFITADVKLSLSKSKRTSGNNYSMPAV